MHHWVVRLSVLFYGHLRRTTGPRPTARRDAATRSGSSRNSRPVQRRTMAPVVTRSRSRTMSAPPSAPPPCGSRRRPPGPRLVPSGSRHSAVGVAAATRGVRAAASGGPGVGSPCCRHMRTTPSSASEWDPAADVLEGSPGRAWSAAAGAAARCPRAGVRVWSVVAERRRREVREPCWRRPCSPRIDQRCRLGAPGRESAGREQAERPTCLNEADALQRLQVVRLRKEDRDLVSVPVAETSSLQSRQTTDRASATGVEDTGPHQLLTCQRPCCGAHDHLADQLPLLGRHPRVRVVIVVAELDELAPCDEPALGRGNLPPGGGTSYGHDHQRGDSSGRPSEVIHNPAVVRLGGCSRGQRSGRPTSVRGRPPGW